MGTWGRRYLALLLAAPSLAMGTSARAEGGYDTRSVRTLGPGVTHTVLARRAPAQVVNVARIAPGAPYALRAVLSGDAVAEAGPRLERTSAMCARTRCLVAVNADFAHVDSSEPVGGVVSLGRLVRSPTEVHHQLVVGPDGRPSAGAVRWSGALMPTDFRRLDLTGVNVPRGDDALVLYTPAWAPTTQANPHGAEMTIEIQQGSLRVGQTALVRIAAFAQDAGDTPIPPGGAVLSGHGRSAAALGELWSRVQSGVVGPHAMLRVETDPPSVESVGGSPVLLRDGRRWFSDAATSFVRGRHPRTAAGWNPAGETLLVTVDGRQPGHSEGVTLAELADLLLELGATDAINLDGGGSTTFVTGGGRVANRPSDRAVRRSGRTLIVAEPARGDRVISNVERPVVVGLVLVPRTDAPTGAADPLAGVSVASPQALALAPPMAADPASDPTAALPAIVPTPGAGRPAKAPAAALAVLVLATAVTLRWRAGAPRPHPSAPSGGSRS